MFSPLNRTTSAGLILVLAAGCSGKQDAAGGFEMPPMPVEIASVQRQAMVDRFEVIGTIEAGEAITVVAEIDALVQQLPFTEGGAVAAGALLAQLDDVELRADVARSAAIRDQSRTTFDRITSIVDQGAGAPQDLDDAGAALKVAEADLAMAEARLRKTAIRAPWRGIAGARRVSPGAYIRRGEPITDLAQIEKLRVQFSAPERYLAQLSRGAKVRVSTIAFPGVELEGTIDIVEPVLDAATRSARIVARVENPGDRFRPGMSANVSAVLVEYADALTIPSEAVFVEGGQGLVYVVNADNSVRRVAVELGMRSAAVVEVRTGIQEGDAVVRAGHHKLFEGAKVMPVQSSAPAGGMQTTAGGSGS